MRDELEFVGRDYKIVHCDGLFPNISSIFQVLFFWFVYF